MNIVINRVYDGLPYPHISDITRPSFDLYSRVYHIMESNKWGIIPVNIRLELPKGYILVIVNNPDSPNNDLLIVPNIIFRGDKEELEIQVYNSSNKYTMIASGDIIAKAFILHVCASDPICLIEDKNVEIR